MGFLVLSSLVSFLVRIVSILGHIARYAPLPLTISHQK